MPTNTERIAVDYSYGSFVKAIDLSGCPERTKVILKAIIFDSQVSDAFDVHRRASDRKCYIVFYGAGPQKTSRFMSKSRRVEE